MQITLDTGSVADYEKFLKIKQLPRYDIRGRTASFPDEYAARLGIEVAEPDPVEYEPLPGLFDYQRDIARMAITKRKFAVFADCGLGKTLIFLEFVRHALKALPADLCALIVSPLMVVRQTEDEDERFYHGELPIKTVRAKELNEWLANGDERIGITNYEAITDKIQPGRLGCLVLDESSMLKSMYGKWGTRLIEMGKSIDWKMCCTGTPAPNDRIEYANHAVFLDAFPTTNAFLARYFVNKGQTSERWIIKPHALGPFYRSLSHWCIFLTNPATYGWKDNCENIPPIHVHIHRVDMTAEQHALAGEHTGELFANEIGGIGKRSKLSQIAKGSHNGKAIKTNKFEHIRQLVDSWPEESTIIWCIFNREQESLEKVFPNAASLKGTTPIEKRETAIADFKAGRTKVLISKPKILGFGLNLQMATRQVFSGLQDSYESYYQAVKRSNRYGSTRPLNVHIPVADIERPMIETVLKKAKRVQHDAEEQERTFKANGVPRLRELQRKGMDA